MNVTERPDVLVADHGVDALMLHRDDQRPLLILQPYMSFGAAVRAVSTVIPTLPRDEVRHLVREHLPNPVDLDEMLPTPPPGAGEKPGQFFGVFTPVALVVSALVMALLAAGFVFIHLDTRDAIAEYARNYHAGHSHQQLVMPGERLRPQTMKGDRR